MRIAVYPGSFDPFTLGHLDILERSLKMFDKVVVGVLVNSRKNSLFSAADRVSLICDVVKGLPGVEVREFEGLLVEFCWKMEAFTIIRGLRAVSDYEYEMQLATINKQLGPTVETVFLMASPQYSFLSSSIVKEVARFGGDISTLVPLDIAARVYELVKPSR